MNGSSSLPVEESTQMVHKVKGQLNVDIGRPPEKSVM